MYSANFYLLIGQFNPFKVIRHKEEFLPFFPLFWMCLCHCFPFLPLVPYLCLFDSLWYTILFCFCFLFFLLVMVLLVSLGTTINVLNKERVNELKS